MVSEKYRKEMQPDYEKQLDHDLNGSFDSKTGKSLCKLWNNGLFWSSQFENIVQRQETNTDNLSKEKMKEFARDLEQRNRDRPKKNFALTFKFNKNYDSDENASEQQPIEEKIAEKKYA